ncbi:MAG: hypothetical protein LBT25_08750, partial [Candidatus Symbiothrix sp.]|nr:hypothetical protein [Candidatus Symbiothrix sp.]
NNTANQLANPWFWGGLAYGGFSTYKSFVAFDMCNPWYWTNVKGVRISTQMLDINPATENLFRGRLAYENSFISAAKRATPLAKVATKLSYVGLIIPVAHTIIAGEFNVEDTTDFVFAAVAFIPAVGWVISGLYVVVDTISVLTTEEKIYTHVKRLPDRMTMMWVELNQGIKNWINSMCFGVYGIPNL